ncbi:MAG: hypothetical protein ABIV51_02660 [Saprospiraceae bacterium]
MLSFFTRSDDMHPFFHRAIRLAFLNLVLTALIALYAQGIPLFGWSGGYAQVQYIALQFFMTGWIFTILFASILGSFPVVDSKSLLAYRSVFVLAQIGSYGMLCSHLLDEMDIMLSLFALVFTVATTWFSLRVIRDTYGDSTLSRRFLVLCLIFLFLSSSAPYVLAWLDGTMINERFVQNATYFFFHIGYNGWITFGIAALVIRYLEMRGWAPEGRAGRRYFRWMAYSSLFTFFLHTLWGEANPFNYVLAGFGALLQIGASVYLMHSLSLRNRQKDPGVPLIARRLFLMAGIAFLLKIALQMASAFPRVAEMAYRDHPMVHAFLIEILVGFVSFFFIAWAMRKEWMLVTPWLRLGVWLFVAGFFAFEIILAIEGIQFAKIKTSPAWFQGVLFISTSFMVLGTSSLAFSKLRASLD